MKREEIARRMRESVIDEDKELIVECFEKMRKEVTKFHSNEINLKGNYPNLSLKSAIKRYVELTYKNNILVIELEQDDHRILVTKETDNSKVTLDEIVSKNKNITCFDGEFKIEEIDEYLSKCFAKLLD